MNKLLTLVLHEVSRQFKSERAFYQTIGITQRAWEKYKNGETNFSNIKLSTYNSITTYLFTKYETMLIDQAIQATNFNWYDNVVDAFHDIKLKHAKIMLDRGATIEYQGGKMDDERNRYNGILKINIVDEIDTQNRNKVSFEIKYPSTLPKDLHLRMPSGKRNRREWFDKHFDEVVVK